MKSNIQKLIASIVLVLFSNSVLSNPCDTIDSKIQMKYEKYSVKKMRKLLLADDKKTDDWFLIAEYLRHKGDTSSKLWYQKIASKLSTGIKGDYYDGGSNVERTKLFYIVGVSYYYLGNQQQAKKYFSSVLIRTSNNHSCADYYLNQIELTRSKD